MMTILAIPYAKRAANDAGRSSLGVRWLAVPSSGYGDVMSISRMKWWHTCLRYQRAMGGECRAEAGPRHDAVCRLKRPLGSNVSPPPCPVSRVPFRTLDRLADSLEAEGNASALGDKASGQSRGRFYDELDA